MEWISINKIAEKERWHVWFAWYPVIVNVYKDGNYKVVWFKRVLRCGIYSWTSAFSCWSYKYKEVEPYAVTTNR